MASQGDDCYFYYYSSCSKGDDCGFRHCEEALGNETVCTLWMEGRCQRDVCRYRHMDIKKDRSSIPCYWETQPGGCQKPHCVFLHQQGKDQSGINLVTVPSVATNTSSNRVIQPPSGTGIVTQLGLGLPRRRSSAELDKSVEAAAPQVEPVVVNFEDESDQESPNTTPVKHIRPLEEIIPPKKTKIVSLRRPDTHSAVEADSVLTSSLIRDTPSIPDSQIVFSSSGTQRRIIQSYSDIGTGDDEPALVVRRDVVSRLGTETRQISTKGSVSTGGGVLSRLGSMSSASSTPSSRLGTADLMSSGNKGIMDRLGKKLPGQAKERSQIQTIFTEDSSGQPEPDLGIKTLSEIKKQKALKAAKTLNTTKVVTKRAAPSDLPADKMRIKSLDEIRMKKQARLVDMETTKPDSTQPGGLTLKKGPRQERQIYVPPGSKKQPSIARIVMSEGTKKNEKTSPNKKKTTDWGVKTYSEIMREKQMKKLEIHKTKEGEKSNKRPFSPIRFSDQRGNVEEPRKRSISPVRFDLDTNSANDTVPPKKTKRTFSPITFSDKQTQEKDEKMVSQTRHEFVPVVFDLDSDSKQNPAPAKKEMGKKFTPIVFDLESEDKSTAGGKKKLASQISSPGKSKIQESVPRIRAMSSGKAKLKITTNISTASITLKSPPIGVVQNPSARRPSSSPGVAPHTDNPSPKTLKSPSLSSPPSTVEMAIAKAVQQRTVSSTSDDGNEETLTPKPPPARRLSVRRSSSKESRLSAGATPTSSGTRSSKDGKAEKEDSFLDEELDDLLGDISDLPAVTDGSPYTEVEDDALLLEMEELLS